MGKTYDIHWVSGKPLDEDDLGELDPTLQKISIRKGQPWEQEQDTLLHEVVHAVDCELSLNMKESQVHGVATGILAVLKDNPKLMRFITRTK